MDALLNPRFRIDISKPIFDRIDSKQILYLINNEVTAENATWITPLNWSVVK
jgi:hypothetical protein